jgi:hypothetical protein
VRAAHRLQNSMKMDHTGIGCGAMDWIQLALDKAHLLIADQSLASHQGL